MSVTPPANVPESALDSLELFHGQATEALCRVYARLRFDPGSDLAHCQSLRLSGTLAGPTCPYAQTLPATFTFSGRGTTPSLLAEALVPEPVVWTPELPHVYEAHLQLHDGDRLIGETRRLFGIRRLGARGRGLSLAARPWVLRGVQLASLSEWTLQEPRTCDAALLVPDATDLLCDSASRNGALLAIELKQVNVGEIARLARWPAVGIIVLPAGSPLDLAGLAHNVLLVERFSAKQPVRPQAWADAALVDVEPSDTLPNRIAECGLPILTFRGLDRTEHLPAARAACDRLQRDLASIGQFAGYIV